MKRLLTSALLIAAVILVSSTANATGQSFKMTAQNNSKEDGTVTLTPILDKTRVEIKVANEEDGAIEPAHIHVGSCARLGGVKYPLKNVVRGKSTTIVAITPDQVVGRNFAVNVHKSKAEIGTYVSCGNLK